MEASDYEELQPLLKSKSEAKATQSTMFQDVFCVILLLFPGNTVKLGIKELLNKELFTDYHLFYTINLLLNKELLPI